MSYYNDPTRAYIGLTTRGSSPAQAPEWQLSRVVTEQDAAFDERTAGVNCSGYRHVRFAVTPMQSDPTTDPDAEAGGTDNPDIEIRMWSPYAKAFVPWPGEALTITGAGAGEGYIVDVPNANGAIIGCFVTNAVSGVVAIAVQGFNYND